MASLLVSSKVEQTIFKTWLPLIYSHRYRNKEFGRYKNYLEPIQSREELERLDAEGELEALRVLPIKPAPTNMTNSLYDDPVLNKFTNMVMQWGYKTLARELMFETFARIKRIQLSKYHKASEGEKPTIELDPKVIFIQAVENCKPMLSVTPIKKGGITYQVPMPVTINKSRYMSMKWLIMAARDKDGPISFVEQMSKELLDAFHSEGRVIKRKQDLHKLCENNKAYAHYRWS